jgi:hypothetical protein
MRKFIRNDDDYDKNDDDDDGHDDDDLHIDI